MKVVISGASGLVGRALVENLSESGAQVIRLVRGQAHSPGSAPWDPATGILDPDALDGVDVVVNLSGENVADGSWTAKRKKSILESRLNSTKTLVNAMRACDHPPAVLISASAIGYYGDCGATAVEETTPLGAGFLASVCRDWEAEAMEAAPLGVRVVLARFGIVLSTRSGALSKMLTPFRLGLGGPLGNGEQYMSWIALADAVRALRWCASRNDIQGPVNLVAPQAVTNREFTAALARELHRPAFFPAPAFLLKGVLGEMADEMLLSSTRVIPRVLRDGGFDFEYPALDEALHGLLREGR